MPDFRLASTDTLGPADLHAAFTKAFSDYLVPFALSFPQWLEFTARHCVDWSLGRAAIQGGEVVAFAFVAPRPPLSIWRLAALGAQPVARGSGAAQALLDDFIARAAIAGLREVELECFAQNERAVRLYRSRGFAPVHPLYGYLRQPVAAVDDDAVADDPAVDQPAEGSVQTIALDDAFAWLDAASLALRDLPLQVTSPSIKAITTVLQAWRAGDAQLVFSETATDALTIHSLVDRQPEQDGAQLLAARLMRLHPGRRIVVPQLQRPNVGGDALERLGFQRLPLHGLLMRRPL